MMKLATVDCILVFAKIEQQLEQRRDSLQIWSSRYFFLLFSGIKRKPDFHFHLEIEPKIKRVPFFSLQIKMGFIIQVADCHRGTQ
jgi:hypothetical protein